MLQYMSKFKRKQKEKWKKPQSLNLKDHRRSSDRFGLGYDDNESSKDCYEELREAIRDGLAKQNLLPKTYDEEQHNFTSFSDRFGNKKSDLSLEFPSTSSSQSSMYHSREFDASDNSFQWSFEESSTFTQQRQLGNYKKTLFLDMDLHKFKMPNFPVHKADSPQRTLDELIQTVQFKELVTSPVINARSDHRKQLSKINDSPPIVIIKPMLVSGSLLEKDFHKQVFINQDMDIQEIIKKLKLKEKVSSRTSNVPRENTDINELQRNLTEDLDCNSSSTPLAEARLTNEAIQIDHPNDHDDDDLEVIKLTISEEVSDGINNTSEHLECKNKTESHYIDYQKSDYKSKKTSNVTRNELLYNPLFINKVEELFYTNAPTHQLPSGDNSNIISESLLDCAKELLENKSLLQSQQFSNVFVTKESKKFIFLDQLIDEICEGIEDLRKYQRIIGEKFAENTLPKVLYRDLWCKGAVNGGWDLGWRNGFNRDEAVQIVVNIQQEILNGIIDDMVAYIYK